MRKLRINIIQGAFLPVPAIRGGAVEKMWYRLGQEFAEAGHQVVHISRSYGGLSHQEFSHGVQHQRLKGYDQPRSGVWLKLLDLFYSRRAVAAAPSADITVSNTFWTPILAGKRHGKIVIDVQRMPKGQLRFYDHAARLRANSSAVSDAMIHERPSVEDRVRIIPNALTAPPSENSTWRERPPLILYVGRIHPEKGMDILLSAWSQITQLEEFRDWELHLVGPVDLPAGGGGDKWWSTLTKRLGGPRVKIIPPIYDEAELNRHYATARLFVYPSLAEKGETFGSAILESMSHGTPPVVSSLNCFTDFVQANSNGFVFNHRGSDPVAELGKTLQSAMSSDLTSHSAKAEKVNSTHSPAHIARTFLDDFHSLL